MTLNHHRNFHGMKPITDAALHRALQGEISSVRKVYDAVPMNEPWTVPQIIAELKRVGVTSLGLTQVVGTCQLLRAKGVIKEVGVKNYLRIPVQSVSKKKKTIINESEIKAMTEKSKPDPECSLKRTSSALLSLAADLETLSSAMSGPSAEQELIISDLRGELAEARRIGKEWNEAIVFEKAAHNVTRDELHKVQGENERLAMENSKFAQLKLLLREGL